MKEVRPWQQLGITRLGKDVWGARRETPTLDCMTQLSSTESKQGAESGVRDPVPSDHPQGPALGSPDPLWLIIEAFDFNPSFLH